jgi:hypothetical protein
MIALILLWSCYYITLCNIYNLSSWSLSTYEFKDNVRLYSMTGSSFFITASTILGLAVSLNEPFLFISSMGLYIVMFCKWYKSYLSKGWLHSLITTTHYIGAFICAFSGLWALYNINVFQLRLLFHFLIAIISILIFIDVDLFVNKSFKHFLDKITLFIETYVLYTVTISYLFLCIRR